MLGAGARHQCSRPCRRTRCLCLRSCRSRRRCAIVEPSLRPLLLLRSHFRRVAVTPLRSRCRCVATASPPRCRLAAVAVTSRASQSRCCFDVAPTIAVVAVALPSWLHCRCGYITVASILESSSHRLGHGAEALMLGVGRSPGTDAHGFLVHALSLLEVASLLRRCCRGAPLRPSPSSQSPCRHVAVAPLRSRCHRAFAGDRRAYAPRAVPRCLVGHVGRPWLCGLVGGVVEVVVAVVGGGCRSTRLAPYSSAFRPPLALHPSWCCCWHRCRRHRMSPCRGGGGGCHHPRVVRHQCVVDSCASGRLCCTRAHCGGGHCRAP